MTHIWQGLRSGRWLTAERARGYSLILLGAYVIAMVGWIALSDGLIDRNGKPIGTDSPVSTPPGRWPGGPARRRLSAGAAACRRNGRLWRREVPYYGWQYPPFFFAIAVPWPPCPMPGACDLAWREPCGLSGGDRDDPSPAGDAAIALAFPAVFVNIGHGQNGFLTAALLGGGLHLLAPALARRPADRPARLQAAIRRPDPGRAAGRGQWRTIGAAVRPLRAAGGRFAMLGGGMWNAFANSTTFTQTWCSNRATSASKRSNRYSRRCGCGAAASDRLGDADRAGAGARRKHRMALASDADRDLKAAALATGSLLATLCSITTWSCWRPRSPSSLPRAEGRLPRFRNQPAGRRMDRAAVGARRRRHDRHPTGPVAILALYAVIVRRAIGPIGVGTVLANRASVMLA